ncbi:hypothetical protein ACSLV1_30810 [Pseudomonas aeruginosa]|uniref:Uncharacterized protein n=1 Tax=Pseudomonas paraeruginosa (strain DSM 24068 / PA7) TaxID=381754 RepID=A6V5S6_PSEP7|nr:MULTISPECIES: hypothetical protein [Pseudomonas aeruginosa group]ABR83689.1 hypothetical protein PSPA7_3051 [Pseudomonas aeruginosa PA7]EJV1367403.1 hypothetical protein [Pseudomonas aeruginosa]EJV1384119.1 hypothetical protein [Pseudomonas aeruginosa]EJV1607243.1 hypothetical protein [Pseudomonas aeruginosa]EKD1564151.1 hypothetical protein [Pseudomonas aeruginosa]
MQQQLVQEYDGTATYVRGVENRAHCEVDRAREASRAVTVQPKTVSKQPVRPKRTRATPAKRQRKPTGSS